MFRVNQYTSSETFTKIGEEYSFPFFRRLDHPGLRQTQTVNASVGVVAWGSKLEVPSRTMRDWSSMCDVVLYEIQIPEGHLNP